jgi:hypothetical protein
MMVGLCQKRFMTEWRCFIQSRLEVSEAAPKSLRRYLNGGVNNEIRGIPKVRKGSILRVENLELL